MWGGWAEDRLGWWANAQHTPRQPHHSASGPRQRTSGCRFRSRLVNAVCSATLAGTLSSPHSLSFKST